MNKHDLSRNLYMLKGPLASHGYDWWWHSFTGFHAVTGEEKSFFIEYFIINPAINSEIPLFGDEGKQKPCYVMIKAGAWGKDAKQIHSFYSIKDMTLNNKMLKLKVGDCSLSETRITGITHVPEEENNFHPEYMSDSGSMSWDLKVDKKIAFHVGYGASKFFRLLNAFEMYWHAEGMKTEFKGKVILDREEYVVSPGNCYGYSDKNWGKDFTSPWVWLASSHLFSKISGKQLHNSAFDIGGGKPKIFGMPLNRKLLLDFYYEGKDYEFNFSKFWTGCKTKFKCTEEEDKMLWQVVSRNHTAEIRVKITCAKKDMLFINYEAPNGLKLHDRLWNGGTGKGEIKLYDIKKGRKILVDHMIAENVGCEYGEYIKG